ncbi:MAG: RHS repeat-associated core domain-containing protein [Kiloniellales bacterium]|nr:RHS repeat-associated core domain-containing protein [Kiloniellales bacterium]
MTGAGEDGYLYDANGNMTSHIAGGATHGPSVLGARTQTAGSFFPDVLMAGFTVPEGENRVLLVAVSHEEGTIGSVTFGGQPLSQVGALVNDETGVALFELREAQLGPGAQTADLEVDFLGFSDTEVTAFTVTGVDQAAAATIAQAAQPVAASSISADITTSADTAILVSAVGLDSPAIWSPGAGETQIGYAETGAFAGGASYEVVAAGSHDMSWSGDLALRPTLLVAAYPAAETGGGSSVEKTIAWSSFNKPTLITEVSTGDEAGFTYGPDRARIRQHVVEGGAARDVIYIGSLYERRIQLGSPDELVHYVVAGGTVAIHTVFDDNLPATNRTRYLHRDHLGSIETITGETGAVVQRLSFDAHGQRRLADWTAGDPAAPGAETPRGFTGHEHLDAVGLIHMNGRVYDPVLGRFLSADPIVPDPETTKSFNRYTYVHNNPLSFTDPSGFGLDGPTDHGHGMDQGKDQASGIGVSESYGGGRGTHGGGVGPHGHKSYGADARNEPMDHRGFLSSGRGFAEALGAAAEAAGLGFAALDRWGDDVLGLGLTHPANIEDDFYTARNKGEIRKAIGLLDRARRFGVLPGKISQMVEALQHAALQGKGGTKGVAYVGGALDETLEGFAFKAYLRAKRASSAAVSATVNVAYFSWDEPEELADFIEAHKGAVAVFGHSYGADTAAAVVAAGHRVELLVTVDPVSNFGVGSWFGPSYSQVQLNARTWRNYNATKGDLTFGNVVAGLGGSWDGGPRSYSKHFDRPYNHGEIMAVCGSFLGC